MERLPLEGAIVSYDRGFLDGNTANAYYDVFADGLDWKIRTTDYGKGGAEYQLNRATCAYGDNGVTAPVVWGSDLVVHPWTPELADLKTQAEILTGHRYNICLCNRYDNGKRAIGFHADNEERGSVDGIASVSLGAERRFVFRKNSDGAEYTMTLHHGSLLFMSTGCQENYRHSVPVDKDVDGPRINLTFRWFDPVRYDLK